MSGRNGILATWQRPTPGTTTAAPPESLSTVYSRATAMDSTTPTRSPRIAREQRTLRAMVEIYCRDRHGVGHVLCPTCQSLLDYAFGRLDHCPFTAAIASRASHAVRPAFQANTQDSHDSPFLTPHKPTCAQCPIHCYKPAMRAEVQQVMRYAGPRMLWRHPWLTLRHQCDALLSRFRRPKK